MPRRKLEEVVDGIYMEPVPITVGDEVRLKYKGKPGGRRRRQYLFAGRLWF